MILIDKSRLWYRLTEITSVCYNAKEEIQLAVKKNRIFLVKSSLKDLKLLLNFEQEECLRKLCVLVFNLSCEPCNKIFESINLLIFFHSAYKNELGDSLIKPLIEVIFKDMNESDTFQWIIKSLLQLTHQAGLI